MKSDSVIQRSNDWSYFVVPALNQSLLHSVCKDDVAVVVHALKIPDKLSAILDGDLHANGNAGLLCEASVSQLAERYATP